jgi:hypothetical protein
MVCRCLVIGLANVVTLSQISISFASVTNEMRQGFVVPASLSSSRTLASHLKPASVSQNLGFAHTVMAMHATVVADNIYRRNDGGTLVQSAAPTATE